MDAVVNLINNRFGQRFEFLKTLDVSYNQKAMAITISFIYPQSIFEISQTDKQEIFDFLNHELNLHAKLYLKFKKSFLDESLVATQVLNFFRSNYASLASLVKEKDLLITTQGQFIDVKISVAKEYIHTFDQVKLLAGLDAYMQKHFCASFTYHFKDGQLLDSAEIEEKLNQEKLNKITDIQFLPRYKVYDIVKIVGKEINPEPEFLLNINEPKTSVILAGSVSHITERQYKRMKKGQEILKTYFKFELKERTNAKISCIHFCAKSNIEKMRKLTDGSEILMLADIEKDNNFLTAKIKALALCSIPENIYPIEVKKQVKEFKEIKPEKIISSSQKNLFKKEAVYNDNIKNNTFVVFDVETTGLDPQTCELIEIGAVKVEEGVMTEKFQTLIKPKTAITSLITDITNITNEMVENAPPVERAIKDFYLFCKDAVLSGYNVGFDMSFITKAAEEVGLKFDNQVQDVLTLAREKVSSKNYKLGTIVKKLDIKLVDAHRAYNDAYATAQVLLKLNERQE